MSNSQTAPVFRRAACDVLLSRLREPRRFMQALSGPRQSGKTTVARQVMESLRVPSHYASADEPTVHDRAWIEAQWEIARREAGRGRRGGVFFLDEAHKVAGWSETVKRLWDEDTRAGLPLRVVLLGSAPLLLQRGLGESLGGRFETIPVPHWSYGEMREAFRWTVDRYVYFGGYPGAAPLVHDRERWARYIRDSLIETTLSRDVLLLSRVDKPALLRQLFHLACTYSGQVLSYQKMVGQLQDAGNTTTLAHYLDLLRAAGLVAGLPKYSGAEVRQRGSSPKLQVLNTALASAVSPLSFEETRRDPELWGRLVESAVGAHLANGLAGSTVELAYWRDRGREVDFVVPGKRGLLAIEVKTGRRRTSLPGLDAFLRGHRPARPLLVGGDGIPVDEFLATPPDAWLRA
jgi:hypothetical protein